MGWGPWRKYREYLLVEEIMLGKLKWSTHVSYLATKGRYNGRISLTNRMIKSK
jgi:hypothetical protein